MLSNLNEATSYEVEDFLNNKLNGKEVKALLHKLQSTNIEQAFKETIEELGITDIQGTINIDKGVIIDMLKKLAISKDKAELRDLLRLGADGELVTPLSFPLVQKNLVGLFTSMFNNRVTNQKINGGHMVLFSDVFKDMFGVRPYNKESDMSNYGSDLNVTMLPNGTLILDCKISVYTAKLLKLTEDGSNIIDINSIKDKSLLKAIGYRIPTTGHQSAIVLNIVEILPPEVKSSIVVNNELIARTGTDFDVDSLYLMFKVPKRKLQTWEEYKTLSPEDYTRYEHLKETFDNLKVEFKELTTIAEFDVLVDAKKKELRSMQQGITNRIDKLEVLATDLDAETLQSEVLNSITELTKALTTEMKLKDALSNTTDPQKVAEIVYKTSQHLKHIERLRNIIKSLERDMEMVLDGSIDNEIQRKNRNIRKYK